jgi:hypothetical protein
MKAWVWPMIVGSSSALAVATLVVYRFPVPHHLHTARTLPEDMFLGSLPERASLEGEPISH